MHKQSNVKLAISREKAFSAGPLYQQSRSPESRASRESRTVERRENPVAVLVPCFHYFSDCFQRACAFNNSGLFVVRTSDNQYSGACTLRFHT